MWEHISDRGIAVADKKTDIIRLLKIAGSNPVSGQEIGEKLGISRAMVSKYIKAIKENGYEIHSSPKIGHVLISSPDILIPDEIKNGLETDFIGKEIVYYNNVDSTNSIAKEIAPKSPNGTIVLAETQSKGRGRRGNDWESLPGGLWFSVILKPDIPLEHASKVTLVAGLAVANVIRKYEIDAKIKWPNDILINGKKVCGILTELNAEIDGVNYIVLGIGINANIDTQYLKDDVRDISTSLENEKGKKIDRTKFLRCLLQELEKQYIRFIMQQFISIIDDWVNLSDTIGREVVITSPSKTTEGKAIGLTESGALLIQNIHGIKEEIIAGHCRHKDN